jgi:hypothetical protein
MERQLPRHRDYRATNNSLPLSFTSPSLTWLCTHRCTGRHQLPQRPSHISLLDKRWSSPKIFYSPQASFLGGKDHETLSQPQPSPNPAARTSLQTLDPEKNFLQIMLRSSVLGSSTGGLHLNGSDSATLDEALALARSNARKEPDIPLTVSPRAFDSVLHEQIMVGSIRLVQDLRPCGVRPPVAALDRRRSTLDAQSFCVSSAVSVEMDSGTVCSEGECTEHVLKADLVKQISQKRIPTSEKMKWGLDGSLGLQPIFNALGDLNLCSDLSHRHGEIGEFVPRDMSRCPIHRSCIWKGKTDASVVDDEGWSVVKPKFWWWKNFDFLGDDPFKQQIEMNGTSFLKKKLSGKCLNCLMSDHYAYLCSAPVRCWQCLQAGHRARSCPRKIYHGRSHLIRDMPGSLKHSLQRGSNITSSYQQQQPHLGPLQKGQEMQPGQAPPITSFQRRKYYLQAVQGGQVMEARYPGDPRTRHARAVYAISVTGLIRRRRDELISKAMVCSFDGNIHEVDVLSAGDMLRETFDLHHGKYQLVKHFPEQFFIIFSDSRTKQWALDRRSLIVVGFSTLGTGQRSVTPGRLALSSE